MGQVKHIQFFNGVMDNDSANEVIDKSNYRSLFNARNKYGNAVNLKGNLSTTDANSDIYHEANPTIAANSIVMNSCDDIENNAIIYFLYNSTASSNAIYRVWVDTNTIELILKDALLAFSLTYPIKRANVIGDELVWTDNNNPIRSINIKKASDYSLTAYSNSVAYEIGDFVSYSSVRYKCIQAGTNKTPDTETTYWENERTIDAYSSIDAQLLSFIKYPPYFEPTYDYISDTTFKSNLLRKKQFQFAYRYIYDDYAKTVLSEYSKIVIPENEIYVNNQFNEDYLVNNMIVLKLSMGHALVHKVDILVREGNNGDWLLYDTIEKYDSDGEYKVVGTFSGTVTEGSVNITGVDSTIIGLIDAGMYIGGDNFSTPVTVGTTLSGSIIVCNAAATASGTTFDLLAYSDLNSLYPFYNDKAGTALDQSDVARPFDYVPLLADSQEAFANTRIAFANYVQGFDNVDIDVSLSYAAQSISALSSLQATIDFASSYVSAVSSFFLYKIQKNGSNEVSEGEKVVFELVLKNGTPDSGEREWVDETYSYSFDVLADDLATDTFTGNVLTGASLIGGIADTSILSSGMTITNANFPSGTYITSIYSSTTILVNNIAIGTATGTTFIYNFYPRKLFKRISDVLNDYFEQEETRFTIVLTEGSGSNEYLFVSILAYSRSQGGSTYTLTTSGISLRLYTVRNMPVYKHYHTGTKYFGIEYADKQGRFGNVNISKDSVVVIPSYSELGVSTLYNYIKVNWTISHRPPIWAYYWRWKIYDNVPDFEWYKFDSYRIDSNGNVRIRINEFVQLFNENNYNSVLSEYAANTGDKIRIIGSKTGTGNWVPLAELLEGGISGGEDDDNGYYEIIIEGINKIFDYDSANYFIAEIYTPVGNLDEKVYNSIGKTYEITNAGTANAYHKAGSGETNQSSDLTTPASGTMNSGDSYFGYRNDSHLAFPVARNNMNDFYSSENYDYGRLNSFNSSARQKRYYGHVRFGGRYIDNTELNYLHSFDYDDYVVLGEKFGAVTAMIEVGDVLKILQEHKENSAYIGRKVLTEASVTSGDFVVSSNAVLGTIYALEDDYGCQDYRSVVKHNRHLYYLDRNKGSVIRSSPNGQQVVSAYFMDTWFKEKCKTLRESTNTVSVFATFIDDFNEYVLVMIDGTTVNAVVFNEDKNGCTHYLNLSKEDNTLVEHIAAMGQTMFSFMEGTLWRHEINDTYNHLFGEQRDVSVKYVVNAEALRNKLFMNISMHTDNNVYNKTDDTTNWDITSISIPSSKMYPSGMSSVLKPKVMTFKEGVIHAAFLRDSNTPGKTGKDAIINGRLLRGKVMEITMQHTNTEEVNLFSVVVDCNFSEKNSL